jgi:Tfp pilus assembly protein PilX
MMKNTIQSQSGMTLLIALAMLVVITILGISAIRMTGSSMLVVGNMQWKRSTENIAMMAIEQTMNSSAPFANPTAPVTFTAPAGYTVTVGNRTCLRSTPASGYSALSAVAPEENIWEFTISVNDTITGAQSSMVQGAKIRQLAGSCT